MLAKNKRAQLGTALVMIIVAILIVVVFYLFVIPILFQGLIRGVEKSSADMSLKESSQISLRAYLQTPIKIAGKGQISMADLIRLAAIDLEYRAVLEEKSRTIFDSVYGTKYHLELPGLGISAGKGEPGSETITTLHIPSTEPIEIRLGVEK